MSKKIILTVLVIVLSLAAVECLTAQQAPPRGFGGRRDVGESMGQTLSLGANEAEKAILQVLEDMDRNQRSGMMNVPMQDGRLLKVLAETSCAKNIVEIGTSNGYSGIWFCLALRSTGGKLITYEIDGRRASLARENFRRAGVERLVRIVEGDAHEKIKDLKGSIDILFLDADKEGYLDYLNKLLPQVRPGGLILAHNISAAGPEFYRAITNNPDLETVFQGQDQELSITVKKRPFWISTAIDVGIIYTPQDVVEKMLETAKVQKEDLVYDLGCGDGRIVVTAAKKYGCKAAGYDIDPNCVKNSIENAKKNQVEHLVEIEQKDIFTLDLSRASVITLFLNPTLNLKLVPQLEKLKTGSRIVSYMNDMEGIEPDQVIRFVSSETQREEIIYLWTIPLKKTKEIKLEESEEDAKCPWCGSPRR